MTKTINYTKVLSRFLFEAGIILSAVLIISAPLFARADTLNRQLEVGVSGSDVSALQTFLAADPAFYPEGLVTGYFGQLTKAAVARFQSHNGISPVGRVGPATLPVLNLQMANMGVSGDSAAPIITSLNVSKNSNSATISWTTNDLARGKVYYSTSPIRLNNTFDQTGVNFVEPSVSGTLAQYDGVARTSQVVGISGLTPNTNYFYLVEVLDSSNNTSITSPASFYTN